MANENLTSAKRAKNDEFYTQYRDIQQEVEAYLEYDADVFRGKVVYCNCDDPYESNFFRYFVLNFKRLGMKRLMTTSYKPSPIANTQLELFGGSEANKKSKGRPKTTANRFVINEVGDIDGDGQFNLADVAEQLRANKNNEWAALEGDGDFRSDECVALLKKSDIVVTNPPFSLFREYVKQLVDYDKKFIIIGNKNSITYKESFSLIQADKMWIGTTSLSKDLLFIAPSYVDFEEKPKTAIREVDGITYLRSPSVWFANIDHGRRHEPLPMMSMVDNKKFNKQVQKNENSYKKYDNYNAIEVPYTNAIPSDYDKLMGVPISFLDKYNPDQFEIIGASDNGAIDKKYKLPHFKKHNEAYINNKKVYKRIFIQHKRDPK